MIILEGTSLFETKAALERIQLSEILLKLREMRKKLRLTVVAVLAATV